MSTVKKLARYGLYALVMVSLGVAARRYLSGEAFLAALGSFNWSYALLVVGLTGVYMVFKGLRFMVFLAPLIEFGRGAIVRAYFAGQVATLLPAGSVSRVAVMAEIGVPVPKASAAVLFASLTDQAVLIFSLIVTALWLEAARRPALIFLAALAGIVALLAIKEVRVHLLNAATWLMKKLHLEDKWNSFRSALDEGVTLKVVLLGLGFSTAAFAVMPPTLALALRGLELSVSPATLVLAYVLPTVLGRLSTLPAGLGVTEASMVGILSAGSGVEANSAAAAVAVFRAGTVFFAALLGGVVYLFERFSGRIKAA